MTTSETRAPTSPQKRRAFPQLSVGPPPKKAATPTSVNRLNRAPSRQAFSDLDAESQRESSVSGTADSKTEGVDAVAKHIQKLPLQAILQGEKLGLFMHHAAEAKIEMSEPDQIRLQAHLHLCSQAKKLSPANAASTPVAEMEETGA